MTRQISGAALVAGVVGAPVKHSLSPLLHGAWIDAAGLDAAYIPFAPAEDGFRRFIEGLRGGVIAGLNVTLPFKQEALALADLADPLATAAGAANLVLFHKDGRIEARNTDGPGLLAAFAAQAPAFDPKARPVVVLGAGGAARGAVAALSLAGAPEVRVLNRTSARAEALAADFPNAQSLPWASKAALEDVGAVINATSGGLNGGDFDFSVDAAPADAVVMDMVYKPLRTPFLKAAAASGRVAVDGLAMLIGQAEPSFDAFFGQPPPPVDVRGLALKALGEA